MDDIRPLATAMYAYLGRGQHPGPQMWEHTARGDPRDPQTVRARAVITAAHAFTNMLGQAHRPVYYQLSHAVATTARDARRQAHQDISARVLLPAEGDPDPHQPRGSIFARIPPHLARDWPALTYQRPGQRRARPIAIAQSRLLRPMSASLSADGHWIIEATTT